MYHAILQVCRAARPTAHAGATRQRASCGWLSGSLHTPLGRPSNQGLLAYLPFAVAVCMGCMPSTFFRRVHESTVLADALRTAFSGSRAVDMGNVSAAVLETLQGGSLRVLMRKHGTPVRWKWVLLGCCPHDPAQANAPEYYALSLESTLGQALAGTVVVEFPSLLLVWQGEEHYTLAARAGPAPE